MNGRLITRREALVLLGASGAAWLAGPRSASAAASAATAPLQCIARPEQTEGPFFVEGTPERSDIRSDAASGSSKPGVPLQLTFRVSRVASGNCAPLAGAQVAVWHCDASGRYSDVDRRSRTSSAGFLRGFQRTDAVGNARFLTIYPGWYGGRAVHVHFKIRTQRGAAPAQEFTSQLYFDDALTDRVYSAAPYSANGRPSMRNADDFIFRQGGRQLLVAAVPEEQGYGAVFDIALM